jgi:hypothetical protein
MSISGSRDLPHGIQIPVSGSNFSTMYLFMYGLEIMQ